MVDFINDLIKKYLASLRCEFSAVKFSSVCVMRQLSNVQGDEKAVKYYICVLFFKGPACDFDDFHMFYCHYFS